MIDAPRKTTQKTRKSYCNCKNFEIIWNCLFTSQKYDRKFLSSSVSPSYSRA